MLIESIIKLKLKIILIIFIILVIDILCGLGEYLLSLPRIKQKELEFYIHQMEELKFKMMYIQQEINLTGKIINMIEKETLIDIALHIKNT